MISQKIGSLFRSLMSPAEEISHGDKKASYAGVSSTGRLPKWPSRQRPLTLKKFRGRKSYDYPSAPEKCVRSANVRVFGADLMMSRGSLLFLGPASPSVALAQTQRP